jgi:hypothetical protein
VDFDSLLRFAIEVGQLYTNFTAASVSFFDAQAVKTRRGQARPGYLAPESISAPPNWCIV